MPDILVLGAIHADGLQRLATEPGFTLLPGGNAASAELPPLLARAEAIIVRGGRVDQALLDQAPRLRFVCRHGVGYDNVDVPLLTERGITLAITPDANATSVAEHALMLMLALSRRVANYNAGVRRGDWVVPSSSLTRDLQGATVLLLGFGRIGARVARLCTVFGIRVLVHDPFIPENTISGSGYEPAPDLMQALAQADIVSLHCPSDTTTRGMVDATFLAAMRPGALLVNTARGTLIDEAALEAALRSGHLAGAGLDVVAEEPMTAAIPLLSLDSVVVTPHVAASTAQGLQRMALASADNVIRFFAGTLPKSCIVNPQARDNGHPLSAA
jgi:D-3-phosphoglycerate dehydrogenase